MECSNIKDLKNGVDVLIRDATFRVAKFADDLSAFKNFESTASNSYICSQMKAMQADVHTWGAKNRVAFDTKKEHFFNFAPPRLPR